MLQFRRHNAQNLRRHYSPPEWLVDRRFEIMSQVSCSNFGSIHQIGPHSATDIGDILHTCIGEQGAGPALAVPTLESARRVVAQSARCGRIAFGVGGPLGSASTVDGVAVAVADFTASVSGSGFV